MARFSGGSRGGSARSSASGYSYSRSSRSSGSGRSSASYSQGSAGGRSSGVSNGSSGIRASGSGGSSSSRSQSPDRAYSANTKSFVAGKIAGQYQAQGYSKARAQRIGNSVVRQMGGTFQPGKGSTKSHTAGVITGRNQSLYGYGLERSTKIGNAVVRRQSAGLSAGTQHATGSDSAPGERSKILRHGSVIKRGLAAPRTPPGSKIRFRQKRSARLLEQAATPALSKIAEQLPARRVAELTAFNTCANQVPGARARPGSKVIGFGSAASWNSTRAPDQNRRSKILGWESLAGGDEQREEVGGVLSTAAAVAASRQSRRATAEEPMDARDGRATPTGLASKSVTGSSLNQRILTEIAQLRVRANEQGTSSTEVSHDFDISDDELEILRFLVDRARSRDLLDCFEILRQLVELQRRVPLQAVVFSNNLDTLIGHLRAIAEAE